MSGQWQPQDLTCTYCRKKKPDVKRRPNYYKRDVEDNPRATHTACDSCDHEVTQDI